MSTESASAGWVRKVVALRMGRGGGALLEGDEESQKAELDE